MSSIRFNVDEIMPQLGHVSSVVANKNAMPILDKVLFQTFNDGNGGTFLLLTTSDGETWLSEKATLIDGASGLSFCIDAKQILNALRNLIGGVVTIGLDEVKKIATCNYESGHFSVPYDEANEYPQAPAKDEENREQIINAERLLTSIEVCEYAMGNDELRPVMNGVHFDFFNDKMVTCATDAHKLVKYSDTSVHHDEETTYGFTLPKKPAHILTSILQKRDTEVKVVFNDKNVTFTDGTFKLVTRLLEMRYPNYDSVIPKANHLKALVSRNDLLTAIKRVLPMGNSTSELIVLHFEQGKVIIESEDFDFSTSAKEFIHCNYNDSGLLSIGFNGSGLLQTIANIQCDNVRISLLDSSRACVFEPEINTTTDSECLSILMPMLIQ